MQFYSPGYKYIYDPDVFSRMIDRVAESLAFIKKKTKFEAIAFSGSSGACLAYPVSARLGCRLIYVRRENETTSSHGNAVESDGNIAKYIILDDFVSSGATVCHIYNTIENARKNDAKIKCVGLALYQENVYAPDISRRISHLLKLKPKQIPIYKV